jgi:hypothetical protein
MVMVETSRIACAGDAGYWNVLLLFFFFWSFVFRWLVDVVLLVDVVGCWLLATANGEVS